MVLPFLHKSVADFFIKLDKFSLIFVWEISVKYYLLTNYLLVLFNLYLFTCDNLIVCILRIYLFSVYPRDGGGIIWRVKNTMSIFFFTVSIKMSIHMYTKNEQVKWVCVVVWLDWNFTYVAGSVGTPPPYSLGSLCFPLYFCLCLYLLKTSCWKRLRLDPRTFLQL